MNKDNGGEESRRTEPDSRMDGTPDEQERWTPEEIYRRTREIMQREFPRSSVNPAESALESGAAADITPAIDHQPSGAAPDGEKKAAVVPAEPEMFQARMLNEYVYCPRLFYYEFVEGLFVQNEHTLRGSAHHKRVDKGTGALPAPGKSEEKPREPGGEAEVIHSRSVSLGSASLGVTAKMDLVEARAVEAEDLFTRVEVCPVDYKEGKPREGEEGNELWDTDKMQLGLQCLLLRDNGYQCGEGIIYYRGSRQRVRLKVTPELEEWIRKTIADARRTASGPIPPPLVASPKCAGCSLVTVCLPDETRLLQTLEKEERDPEAASNGDEPRVRRLIAARDDRRAVYLNTQGWRIGRKEDVLQVKEKDRVINEARINDVSHVALFGNIQISTQTIQALCENEVPVTYFSMGGWFYGITRGHELKNVFLRIEQFRLAALPGPPLAFARQFVFGKIRNHRTLLRRNHVEPPASAVSRLNHLAASALRAESMEELLGTEGAAAALYFQNFNGMLKQGAAAGNPDDDPPADAEPVFTFDFQQRNRRPPADPVNALLSLAYSLLAKDCTLALLAVGFDPYCGFYHRPRFGRPALALDLMEEFRPLIAESTVLSCINNRVLKAGDFVRAGRAVNLTAAGRKRFFEMYEQRTNSLLTHPVFDYKVSYRRALELQARLLARCVTGEFHDYVPLTTR